MDSDPDYPKREKAPQRRQDDTDGVVLDSETLIRKAFEDDYDNAIELLFRRYYTALCSHAIRYVSSKEVAEDIVSDVFYNFYTERLFDRVQSSYRAYLFTTIRNRAINYLRLEVSRNVSLESAAAIPVFKEQQPDEIVHFENLYHDVEKAVNALPLQRRRVYIMQRLEGKKNQEIADELGISVKTVKEHMYQSLRQVRGYLRKTWMHAMLVVFFYQPLA